MRVANGKIGIIMMMELCQHVLDGRGMLDKLKISVIVPIFKGKSDVMTWILLLLLSSMFILHSRESEWYCYILDGTFARAWELPLPRFLGHLSSTLR